MYCRLVSRISGRSSGGTPASLASPRCAQVGSGALARLVKTRLETRACKIFLDADLPAHDVRTHFDEVRARAWYVGSSEGIAGRMG